MTHRPDKPETRAQRSPSEDQPPPRAFLSGLLGSGTRSTPVTCPVPRGGAGPRSARPRNAVDLNRALIRATPFARFSCFLCNTLRKNVEDKFILTYESALPAVV
jgi:hypothetical protein